MSISGIFLPKPTLADRDIQTGLHWMTWEAAASLGFNSITTSGILVAFALALGANNFQIGILAAAPFLLQILQIPGIWFVEKMRKRKVIALLSWIPSQLMWIPIAIIPLFLEAPSENAVSMLLGLIVIEGVFGAVCLSSWNSWIRDLIPQQIFGRFFSKRMAFATISGVVFSLCAAFFIDIWHMISPSDLEIHSYTYVLLFGAIFLGLASPVFMSLIPEPLMQPITGTQPSFLQRITAPLKDVNFNRLIRFLLFWSFSSNLAIPFFAVHMLQRLGLPVSWVIAFSILSQAFNILFLRVWGPFADRFGNKSVLSVGL